MFLELSPPLRSACEPKESRIGSGYQSPFLSQNLETPLGELKHTEMYVGAILLFAICEAQLSVVDDVC